MTFISAVKFFGGDAGLGWPHAPSIICTIVADVMVATLTASIVVFVKGIHPFLPDGSSGFAIPISCLSRQIQFQIVRVGSGGCALASR